MVLGRYLRHPRLRGIWTGLLSVAVVALLLQFPFAKGIDDWLFDGCFSARSVYLGGPRPSATFPRIVIISLDEEDFDALQKPIVFMSPELGQVIAHARRSGAAAVGVDMMIPNSLTTVEAIIDSRKFGKATEVGKAIRDAEGGVVLPVSFPPPPRKSRWPVDQWLLKYHDPDHRDYWDRDVGSIDLVEDGDRFIRRAWIVERGDNDEVFPSFALALAAWTEKQPWRWDTTSKTVYLGDQVIPLQHDGKLTINWVGPPNTFASIPFRTVLARARDDEPMPELTDKIALIGTIDPAFQDFHATPFSNAYTDYRPNERGRMAGVEIHANTLATIMDRSFITTPAFLSPWPWLLGFGAGLGWIFARVGIAYGLILMLGHHFAWKLMAIAVLTLGNWRVDLAGMLALGLIAYSFAFANRWRILRRVLEAVKSQALAKALEENPDRLDLKGENREITVMFVDIRGFSSFSAEVRDQPERVVSLLNAYFQAVIPEIEAEGGTINLFMGDGMMILFNAPVDLGDEHAIRAVRAARQLVQTVHAHADEFARLGMPGLRVGVGINTGECVVGAVGSPSRLDYTAIGDVTNAAARLESATKEVGVPILIGPNTYARIPEDHRADLGIAVECQELELKGVGKLAAYPVQIA